MKMYLALALVGFSGCFAGGCSQPHSDVVSLDRVKMIGINDASVILEIEGIVVHTESSAKLKLYQLAVLSAPDSLGASAEAYPEITEVLRTGNRESPYLVFRGDERLATYRSSSSR